MGAVTRVVLAAVSLVAVSVLIAFCCSPKRAPAQDNSNSSDADKRLVVVNGCGSQDLWIASSNNVPGVRNVRLKPGDSHGFDIPREGLTSTRFWPKMQCDDSGEQCAIGSSGGPGQACPKQGCAPPVDSKFEATFGCVGDCGSGKQTQDWWDTSAVDGFTLPFTLEVGSTCPQGKNLDCSGLTLDACPTGEDLGAAGLQDLHVKFPGTQQIVGCYSPCGKLSFANWNNPSGNHTPRDAPAAPFCCPTPPVSADQCRAGPVTKTQFVNLIHTKCANVYGYAYDDGVGLQVCPAGTVYTWTLRCPTAAVTAVAV